MVELSSENEKNTMEPDISEQQVGEPWLSAVCDDLFQKQVCGLRFPFHFVLN